MTDFFKYLQEKIVFLPTVLEENHRFDFNNSFKEYLWETPFKGLINAVHFTVKNPRGLILYFHGNSGNLERWGTIASDLTRFNYDVLTLDYRGYGKSRGALNEKNLFSDAQYAYDFVKDTYGESNIILYGRSLGGSFATKMAAENSPSKLILEAAFYNLEDMFSRWITESATSRISSKMTYLFLSNEYMKNVSCELYHFHGDKDFIVPLKSGQKLFGTHDKTIGQPKRKFIEIPGGSHDDLATFEKYQKEIEKILSK